MPDRRAARCACALVARPDAPRPSHMRRIWRLRPSCITMRSTDGWGIETTAGAVGPSSSATPVRSCANAPRAGIPSTWARYSLGDPPGRMRQPVRQLAVVGHDDQPFGVGIQPPDRIHANCSRHQIGHAAPPPVVRCCTEHAARFVHQVVDHRRVPRDDRTVDLDQICRFRSVSDPGDRAVDRDASRGDQLLAPATAGNTATGHDLVQPLGLFLLAVLRHC